MSPLLKCLSLFIPLYGVIGSGHPSSSKFRNSADLLPAPPRSYLTQWSCSMQDGTTAVSQGLIDGAGLASSVYMRNWLRKQGLVYFRRLPPNFPKSNDLLINNISNHLKKGQNADRKVPSNWFSTAAQARCPTRGPWRCCGAALHPHRVEVSR